MKTQTRKKLFAFIIMMMFSLTFVSAQPCNGNKIRVYKCSGSGVCNSKCVNPNNIPAGWNTVGCGLGCGVICNCRVRPVPFVCGPSCGFKFGSPNTDKPFLSFITTESGVEIVVKPDENVKSVNMRCIRFLLHSYKGASGGNDWWA